MTDHTTAPTLPIALVIDTSASMGPVLPQLHAGVVAALDEAWGTLHALHTTRVGVITAGGEAQIAVELGPPVDPGSLPELRADGLADVAGAIDLVGSEMERVMSANLDRGRRTLRPWVLLVTDGRWERGDAATAIERLHAPPTRPVVCPVGVGDVDETTLARLATEVGFAVDTPDDLPTALRELLRAVLLQAVSDTPEVVVTPQPPTGTRQLEGV